MNYTEYKSQMTCRFWEYARKTFDPGSGVLEEHPSETRPPVFVKNVAWLNVLLRPGASEKEISSVLSVVPENERHMWFRSMTSSQALALSVFGNLIHYGMTGLLQGVCCEEGLPVFAGRDLDSRHFRLEYEIHHLGEPRPTNVDVFLTDPKPLAIECKLTEPEIGSCSRPLLTQNDSAYGDQYCDGNYRAQHGRAERCPLTKRGVKYWDLLPALSSIDSHSDYSPCPLRTGYQLFRNVLAAAYHEGRQAQLSGLPCAVLLYDERNPEFQTGGAAQRAFEEVSSLLKDKKLLRKCTWQMLVRHLRSEGIMSWLSDGLAVKYGF